MELLTDQPQFECWLCHLQVVTLDQLTQASCMYGSNRMTFFLKMNRIKWQKLFILSKTKTKKERIIQFSLAVLPEADYF